MFSKSFPILLILIFGVLSNKGTSAFKCDRNSDDFKCRLTKITPYRYVANYNDSEIEFEDCEAKKIWLLIRHGSRNPSTKVYRVLGNLDIIKQAVLKKCESSNCNLTNNQLENLRVWEHKLGESNRGILNDEGEDEMLGLAKRFQARFPTLMLNTGNNKTFKINRSRDIIRYLINDFHQQFKYDPIQRVEKSAEYFVNGLFGENWQMNNSTQISYDICSKDVYYNVPKASEELGKFKKSDVMKKMLENMSHRLGMNITFDDAHVMRDICAFEVATKVKNPSPWCDLLLPEEIKIMEFAHDLFYYWIDIHLFPESYEHTCRSVKDMFEFSSDDDDDAMIAYFTNSGTVLKMLSYFGLWNNQKPLGPDQYPSNDRLWRSSLDNPAATNVAFITFDCKTTGRSILTMYQEHVVNIPGCPVNIPCPLSVMKEKYFNDKCGFKKLCNV